MSTISTSIIVALCIYFMLMTITLLINNILKKKRAMQAVSSMIESVKAQDEHRRQELLQWVTDHTIMHKEQIEAKVDSCVRGEMNFYRTLANIMANQNDNSLQHLPTFVDGLVSPYKYLANKSYLNMVDTVSAESNGLSQEEFHQVKND